MDSIYTYTHIFIYTDEIYSLHKLIGSQHAQRYYILSLLALDMIVWHRQYITAYLSYSTCLALLITLGDAESIQKDIISEDDATR